MNGVRIRDGVRIAVLFSWIVSSAMVGERQTAQAARVRAPERPLDTPYSLVTSGVRQFTTSSTKVLWHSLSCDERPPTKGAAPAPASTAVEKIARIAAQGSEARTLHVQSAAGYCDALAEPIQSNLAADDQYVYWNTSTGLYKLSMDANVFDKPTLLSSATASTSDVELALSSGYVYVLKPGASSTTILQSVAKSDGATKLVHTISGSASRLQYSTSATRTSPGGSFAYWLQSGQLWRLDLQPSSNGADTLVQLALSVTGYLAEGGRTACVKQACVATDRVYYGVGPDLRYLDNSDPGKSYGVYSAPVTSPATKTIYEIAATSSGVFWLMEAATPCSPLPCFGGTYVDSLMRAARSGGSPTEIAISPRYYYSPLSTFTNLRVAGSQAVWLSNNDILRLPVSAAAVPNLRITGMAITQGIQKGEGGAVEKAVTLIQGRRTFVRVFVQSDGANVSGVTARLKLLTEKGTVVATIAPVNDVGTQLTVRQTPSRANLNDSFLFELPMQWLPASSSTPLRLRAVLNPFQSPFEPDILNDVDNVLDSGELTFQPSAALKVQFVSWGYTLNNTIYYPRLIKDVLQTYSWLIRAFPIASKIIYDDGISSVPGLHPNLWFEYDSLLGAKVAQTDPACVDNLCASAYTNAQMAAMRTPNGVPLSRFFYGFISDAAGFFPRGQACCGTNVSTGPAGSGTWGWDNDGSYADWYAAHEIGHTLGRAHPTPSSMSCGNSASDNSYPYTGAQIGQDDNTEGFDSGDPAFSVPRALYPGTTWFDVMSYCKNQWISDYTYTAMHTYMVANPSRPAGAASAERVRLDGDFLQLSGRLYTSSAVIDNLWRTTSVAATSTPTPGGYAIRLFNAADVQLSEHAFAAELPDDAPYLTFSEVISFAAGTRMVKIVRTSDGAVLGTRAVSANAPVVSGVALVGASTPVTGVVTLHWSAADADGDVLTYTVRYSTNGGATWVGAASGVTGTTTTIDTAVLGGGTGRFRVIASDGANTGHADSADYAVQAKPPMPFILSPGAGKRVQYGQPVNFSGTAFDWQSGGVTSANLAWTSSLSGLLGVGEQVDGLDLPVGEHVVTLVATNSVGLTASAQITLVVEDDLDPPGPTLTAGPLSFHWQVGRNVTETVTDTLSIGNAGSGTVNWEATTDAPWLTLSAITGTEDVAMVLTADPSGVKNGAFVTGTLTMTMAATEDAPAQTIAIPVALSRGADWANPAGYFMRQHVYVPAAVRQ